MIYKIKQFDGCERTTQVFDESSNGIRLKYLKQKEKEISKRSRKYSQNFFNNVFVISELPLDFSDHYACINVDHIRNNTSSNYFQCSEFANKFSIYVACIIKRK